MPASLRRRLSSAVLPNASASACANRFAISRSWVLGKRAQRLEEADQVARHQLRALVQQLIERMLPVGARLAPDDGPGLIVDARSAQVDALAVALHLQLLQVGGKARQVLRIRHDTLRLGAEEIVVPDRQQPQQHRQVACRAARCGNARPWRGSRRACRGSSPARWRSWSTARWPNPSSSGRRPSPRTRTCWRCRCRTSAPLGCWSRPRRNAWRRRPHRPACRSARRARSRRWSSSPAW